MLSNKQLKFIKSLHQRKFRQKYGIFLAEGVKTGEEILKSPSITIEGVYARQEWLGNNAEKISRIDGSKVVGISEKELNAISALKTPNQVLFLIKNEVAEFDKSEIEKSLSLYLDEIKDPGNMGTILRIADWFGIKWVFLSEGCVEVQNPKVIQSTMGAFLRVKTLKMELLEIIQQTTDLPILGTTLEGESIFQMEIPASGILVIGNESKGISSDLRNLLNREISIPRHPEGGAESLNAAVATGIICSILRNENS